MDCRFNLDRQYYTFVMCLFGLELRFYLHFDPSYDAAGRRSMARSPDEVTPQRRSKRNGSDGNTAAQAKLVVGGLVAVALAYYAITSMFQSQVLLPPPTPEKGTPPIIGTPVAVVPANPSSGTNTATNSSQPERDRPKSADNHKAELEKKFGEDQVATVIIKKAPGDPIAIDRYLNRQLFRAAYHEYKDSAKRTKAETTQSDDQAKDRALAFAHKQVDFGPVFVQYRYRLLNSELPYPQVDTVSKAGGTFTYYVGAVSSLEQFASRCGNGENRTIDEVARTITIEAQLPTPLPDPDVEELELQYGRESVARIRVMNVNSQKEAVVYYLESQTAHLDPNVFLAVAGTRAVSPGKYELYVAPVVDLKAFGNRINYGTVSEIEPTVRMITIDATIPNDLPPRPSLTELAIKRRWDWDRLWIKAVTGDDKVPEGEEFYAWAIKNLRGPNYKAHAALKELKQREVEEAHRQEVADALISTLKQSTYIAEQLDAMIIWKNDATERAIIGLIGNSQHHRHSPLIMAALVKMGTKESARALAMGLTDNTYGEDAARSLIDMGSIAEEFVVKFADNRDDQVRTRAYDVLAVIATEKSIPKLRGNITKEKDPSMKDRVKEVLEKIKQRADDAKASADPDSPFSTKPKN